MEDKPLAKLVITGQPVILKNGKMICFNKKTGSRFIKSNERVERYNEAAMFQLKSQWKNQPPITVPVGIKMIFFGHWHRASETIPDLSNLYEAPQDLLQKAGVLLNDRQIEHHDGSRRVCLCDLDCPDKEVIKTGAKKGQKKDSCGAMKECRFSRVEIELYPAELSVIPAPNKETEG
jgi:Holliday junction resolvase RusA-like endonuclease